MIFLIVSYLDNPCTFVLSLWALLVLAWMIIHLRIHAWNEMLLINVCYPVTRGKAQSDYAAPHTAQIVSSKKKHSASFGDELNQSKVILDIKLPSFLSHSTRKTVSSPTQHRAVLHKQHLCLTTEHNGASGRIKHQTASSALGWSSAWKMHFRLSCLHFPMLVLPSTCQVPLMLSCIFHPAPNEQQQFQIQK